MPKYASKHAYILVKLLIDEKDIDNPANLKWNVWLFIKPTSMLFLS